MAERTIHQQRHGYRSGHQLLASTLRLAREDQDVVDRLSDLSGQLRPGETFGPYLTIYPLPSRQFHVVARTWQDLHAPRAGCVVTRSLLVPEAWWSSVGSVQSFVALLDAPDEEAKELETESVDGNDLASEQVAAGARSIELVEAIFLEARKPIVVFEAQQPEAITLRLLSAVWPSLRREFSVCTFALGPRKLAGRDFDLLFAPKTVRARFSDWPGRRIEAGTTRAPRHRWSEDVARSIFESGTPSLVANDPLGVLAADVRGDESALRKTLLWNELISKAQETPSALLGLLDIVNSQSGNLSSVVASISKVFERGIARAARTLSAEETWEFLVTLSRKLRRGREYTSIARSIRREAQVLATANPSSAIQFIGRFANSSEPLAEILLVGVGDGLARQSVSRTWRIDDVPDRVGTFLIANSQKFSRAVGDRIRLGDVQSDECSRFFLPIDVTWLEKATARFLKEVDTREFAPLLPTLLARLPSTALVGWLQGFALRTSLIAPEFDEPIMRSVRDEQTLGGVREVVGRQHGPHADRFLVNTLQLSPRDILWLQEGPLNPQRATRLLIAVMSKASDRSVVDAQRDVQERRRLLQMLAREDGPRGAEPIARLLLLGPPLVDDLLEYGPQALPYLSDRKRRLELVATVLEHGLANAKPGDNRLQHIVADNIRDIGARQVIWWSTAERVGKARLSQNLLLLVRLPDAPRHLVEGLVDELSERMAYRANQPLPSEAYSSWGTLLWNSRLVSADAYLRAAASSLTATIELVRLPVSEILMAAFPGVYQELARAEDEQTGLMSVIMSLPRMLVRDWDHAKPARHGLIEAFLESSWPPSHLLVAAARAGILDRVLLRLTRVRGGKRYLERAILDLDRASSEDRSLIRQELDAFRGRDSDLEWD